MPAAARKLKMLAVLKAQAVACLACRNDITGARSAGCHAWLWGSDVHSFQEVGECIAAFNSAAA